MSNITIIPARPQRANSQQNETEKPKLLVAAYCRVSTDSDEQATSYETQVAHYTEYITKIPNGHLRAFMPMTVSPARIPKSVRNSTV